MEATLFSKTLIPMCWIWLYNVTYLLTYFTGQCLLWEVNSTSTSNEIPRILWNTKFHYRIHKCPSTVPMLRQLDPVHSPTSHFLKIHLNIIFSSMPCSPKWFPSFRFSHQNPAHAFPLPHTRYMPRLSHSSWFYHPNNIWLGVQIIKLPIM